MSLPVFTRATRSVLARLGQDALLRGSATQFKVHIERRVEIVDANGDLTTADWTATFDVTENPAIDDVLVVAGEGTFRLEAELANNGYSRRFVLLKTD